MLSWVKILFQTAMLLLITLPETKLETNYDCPDPSRPPFFSENPKLPIGTPDRANLTLPAGLSLAQSHIPWSGLGVISNIFIPKYTFLGEFDGEIITVEDGSHQSLDYSWDIYRSSEEGGLDFDDVIYRMDARDVAASNWLRYVNCPRHIVEENVMCVQCYGRRYYVTTRDVAPGQELLVYYGRKYALFLGIEDDEFYNHEFWRSGKRTPRREQYMEDTETADWEAQHRDDKMRKRREFLQGYFNGFGKLWKKQRNRRNIFG